LITVFMVTDSSDDFKERPVRGRLLLAATPFVILLIGAIVLALEWDSIPERWAVHWGFNGQPDGWANKTLFGAFLPFAAGAGICGFLEVIALVVRVGSTDRNSLSPEAASKIARLTTDFVRFLEIAISLMFLYVGVALPLSPPAFPFRFGWLTLIVIGGAIAAAKIQGAIDQIVATLKTEVASGKGIALADVADKVADIARDAESMPPEKKELLRRSVGTISREFSPVADAWIHSGSAK